MSEVVLDASAVLALLRDEPGADIVAGHMGNAAITAVNLQEVAKEMFREGASCADVRADFVDAMVFGGSPARMELDAAPAFAVGAQIRARNIHPAGHTRLPWYVRGKIGCIVAHRGAFVFPDSHAHGLGPDPRHMYSVSFTAKALWGPDARNPRDTVQLELWEPYLEEAGQPS